eukprot:m.122395 g.122395  ORF g.122395 m.122395 type:complete len:142 (+) comp15651_c0_seq10:1873-2298(+)
MHFMSASSDGSLPRAIALLQWGLLNLPTPARATLVKELLITPVDQCLATLHEAFVCYEPQSPDADQTDVSRFYTLWMLLLQVFYLLMDEHEFAQDLSKTDLHRQMIVGLLSKQACLFKAGTRSPLGPVRFIFVWILWFNNG